MSRFVMPDYDPALTKTLHDELHVKLMNSIWPSVGNDTALAHELDAKGLRFAPLHWISKQARVYDAFSPEGRAIYFKHIQSGLLDVGVDAAVAAGPVGVLAEEADSAGDEEPHGLRPGPAAGHPLPGAITSSCMRPGS